MTLHRCRWMSLIIVINIAFFWGYSILQQNNFFIANANLFFCHTAAILSFVYDKLQENSSLEDMKITKKKQKWLFYLLFLVAFDRYLVLGGLFVDYMDVFWPTDHPSAISCQSDFQGNNDWVWVLSMEFCFLSWDHLYTHAVHRLFSNDCYKTFLLVLTWMEQLFGNVSETENNLLCRMSAMPCVWIMNILSMSGE